MGLGAAPPYIPECRSCAAARASGSVYTSPRRPVVMVGSSGANISVSHTSAASHFRRSGCVSTFRHVLAAHFFFAFDEALDVQRQLPLGLEEAFERLAEQIHLPFIVHGTARINVIVADGWLKRRRDPFIQRIGWLHVIVAVEEQRRLAGRLQPLCVNQQVLDVYRG